MDIRTEGLGAFWHQLKRSRTRDFTPPPPPARRDQPPIDPPFRRDRPVARRSLHAISNDRACKAQEKRREQLEAEKLARGYIAGLRPGHYAYRALKDEFDRLSEDCGLNPISDKRFAALLASFGGERYRTDYPKVTMYQLCGAVDKARLVA